MRAAASKVTQSGNMDKLFTDPAMAGFASALSADPNGANLMQSMNELREAGGAESLGGDQQHQP
jgi:hypothetical protein